MTTNANGFLLSDTRDVEIKKLEGIKASYPGLYVDPENRIVMLNRNRKDRVALLCGCRSGYEPFAEGFVGEGMLTAFVGGSIQKPPDTKTISKVIHNLALLNHGGILVLLMNYPKQVLNFGLAIEKARLKGIVIESYVITDDCSRTEQAELLGFEINLALRRGLSGSVFVFKILGAMSSLGYKLWEIIEHAMMLNFRNATLSFVVSPGTFPGSKHPLFELPEGEVAIGCGINIDKGVYNIQETNLKKIVSQVLPKIIELSGTEDTCCVLVNNMGITTYLELYAVANEVDLLLGSTGVSIERMYVGSLMTSFDTKGVMLSVLNCSRIQDWVCYLDMSTEAFAWPGSRLSYTNPKWPLMQFEEDDPDKTEYLENEGMVLSSAEANVFKACIRAALEAIIRAKRDINRLNALTSNGDCGTNMARFSRALLRALDDMPCTDVSETFNRLSQIVDRSRSGTIGTIYAIALNAASADSESWVTCWENAIRQIMKHTSAKPNYRTLLDCLMPAYEIFLEELVIFGEDNWRDAFTRAMDYAKCGCYLTSKMKPKVGRAKHITLSKVTNMDAGAYGVYVWLKAIYDTLTNSNG